MAVVMTDPVSDLVVCRQRLDVLFQQAKAATASAVEAGWYSTDTVLRDLADGPSPDADAAHISTWDPFLVLALVGWIRQTLDGAEAALERHNEYGCWCDLNDRWTGCPEYSTANAVITGLAAVLASDQAVKL